MTESESEKARR